MKWKRDNKELKVYPKKKNWERNAITNLGAIIYVHTCQSASLNCCILLFHTTRQ